MDPITSYYLVSFSLGAISCIVCGFVVYRANHSNPVNLSYALLSLASGIWSLGYFLIITADNNYSAWIAHLIFHNGAIFIAPLFFQFILAFTNKTKGYKYLLFLGYISAIFVSSLTPTKHFVIDVIPRYVFNYTPLGGKLFFLFAIHFWWLILLALFVLFKSIIQNENRFFKQQGIYIASASIFGFIGGGSTFLYSFNLDVAPYPIILFFLYPIIIAFAILRHQLFNAKLLAAEFFTFSLWIFIFIRALISTNLQERIINWSLLALVIVIGIFLIRSVSKEVQAREEIEELAYKLSIANERLKELDKLKSEFVSIASHQLRSPLTAIKGYASLVLDGSYGKISPGVKEAIDKVFQSSQSLVLMVEDFLNISRIEQGKMKYEMESYDLQDLAQKVVAEQEQNVKRVGLILDYSTDKQPPYLVTIDINKIRQVITNLIDNAIKYTPKGSIFVRLYKKSAGRKIILSVSDTGIGINKETIPYLFSKFSRAENANKVNVIGTGLGLYIVKEIVEGHGGKVWVESDGTGKGSSFFVELDEDYATSHALQIEKFAKTM